MEPEPVAAEDLHACEALARAHGATLAGLAAAPVEVEVRLLRGLLGLVKIIGLPDSALRESRERVASRSEERRVGEEGRARGRLGTAERHGRRRSERTR